MSQMQFFQEKCVYKLQQWANLYWATCENQCNNLEWDENIVESVESMHMSSEMRTA